MSIPGNAQYSDNDLLAFTARYLNTQVDGVGEWGRTPAGENKRPSGMYVGSGGITFFNGTQQTTQGGVNPFATWMVNGGSLPTPIYHFAVMTHRNVAGVAAAGDTAFAIPFTLNIGQHITALGFDVAAVNAGAASRVGIYSNRSLADPYPDALLVQSGAIVTNPINIQTAAVDYTVLATGLYWAVLNMDNTGGYSINGGDTDFAGHVLGVNASGIGYTCLRGGMTYVNAMPNPFAIAGQSLSTVTAAWCVFQLS